MVVGIFDTGILAGFEGCEGSDRHASSKNGALQQLFP